MILRFHQHIRLGVDIRNQHRQPPMVKITHTLTSAFCPAADQIIDDIRWATIAVDGVEECEVITTFDPPFGPEMMSKTLN